MRNRTTQFSTIVVLLSSFLLSAVTLAAQTATNDWTRLTSVPLGSKLSVKLKDGKTVDGTLSGVSDSTLSFKGKNAPLELRRDNVLSVHQVTRKSATTATLIGLGVGAGAGAAIGAAGNSGDSFVKLDNAVVAGIAVLGAGVGALGGYFIGRSGKKRVLIYEAK